MHVQYAPHPPQYSLDLSLDQLARRDSRFGHLSALWARGILGDVVQDSADLQGAHLTLRQGHGHWWGTPGRLDEHAEPSAPLPFTGWTERALEYGLGLDLPGGRTPAGPDRDEPDRNGSGWPSPDWREQVAAWRHGVVYILAQTPGRSWLAVTRRLNLSNFFDRAEFDFLAATGFAGAGLIRCHRLTDEGTPLVWRISQTAEVAPP